jgi:hypothetical protein
MRRDLDRRAAHAEAHDDGVLAESLDLAFAGRC